MERFDINEREENFFENREFKLKLETAIQEFSETHTYLMDQKSSKWQCLEVSWEFVKFLNDKNVIVPEMLKDGVVGVHHEIVQNEKHTVAKIGSILIDWTRRQFEPECAFPYIYSI